MPETPSDELLAIEHYYDTVPRAFASVEELGAFSLFVAEDRGGQSYYARPCLSPDSGAGFDADVAAVWRVRGRQTDLGVPEAIEWVDEVTPGLARLVEATGLTVSRFPLLVLGDPSSVRPASPASDDVGLMTPGDPRLAAVDAAIGAGFQGKDEFEPSASVERLRQRLENGAFRLVGAFSGRDAVGGGSHSPRGSVTELTGISVIPRARRRGIGTAITEALVDDALDLGLSTVFLSAASDAASAIYQRLGFRRIATACVAEAP